MWKEVEINRQKHKPQAEDQGGLLTLKIPWKDFQCKQTCFEGLRQHIQIA